MHLALGNEFLSLLGGDNEVGKSWYSYPILVVPSDGVASVFRTTPLWNEGVINPTFRDGKNLIVFKPCHNFSVLVERPPFVVAWLGVKMTNPIRK